METLDSSILGQSERIILYGDPGNSKTWTSATAPGPLYYLVTGGVGELKTLVSPGFKKFCEEKQIDQPEIRYDLIDEEYGKRGRIKSASALFAIEKALDAAFEADATGEFQFQTLVIDNCSSLIEYQLNLAVEFNQARKRGKSQHATMKHYDEFGVLIPADNDWGVAQGFMDQLLAWVKPLEKHVIFTAHEYVQSKRDRASGQEQIISVRPAFIGKQRTNLPRAFDNVWRMSLHGGGKGIYSSMQTIRDEQVLAKTRVNGVLKATEANPILSQLITKMENAG
jgi:hypothetical protein